MGFYRDAIEKAQTRTVSPVEELAGSAGILCQAVRTYFREHNDDPYRVEGFERTLRALDALE